MPLIIHIDGGARGNPGPAGAGVVVENQVGRCLHEAGYFLGRQTNNAAEYLALIIALKRSLRLGDRTVTIYSDSELLVNQITGLYRVKSPNLVGLLAQAHSLLLRFDGWTIRHLDREQNRRADRLANVAMDRQQDAILFDVDGATARHGPDADAPRAQTHADAKAVGMAPMPGPAEKPGPPPRRGSAAVAGPSRKEPLKPLVARRGAHAVRVAVQAAPDPRHCPAAGLMPAEFALDAVVPPGLCLHAAHALLPTALAMINTHAREFSALPTLTVRCMHPQCGATFQLSPIRSSNGTGKT